MTNLCITDDHGYAPFVVVTITFFFLFHNVSLCINQFNTTGVSGGTENVTLPERSSSPPFIRIRGPQSSISFSLVIILCSSIYVFYLPLLYL
jgi:hypothetical protein